MTFFLFLVIDHIFSDFACLYCAKCDIWHIYGPFFTKKPLFHKKKFLHDTIFCSVRTFIRIRQHYFSKYWGTNAWAIPHIKFGGASPKSPPMTQTLLFDHVHVQRYEKYGSGVQM